MWVSIGSSAGLSGFCLFVFSFTKLNIAHRFLWSKLFPFAQLWSSFLLSFRFFYLFYFWILIFFFFFQSNRFLLAIFIYRIVCVFSFVCSCSSSFFNIYRYKLLLKETFSQFVVVVVVDFVTALNDHIDFLWNIQSLLICIKCTVFFCGGLFFFKQLFSSLNFLLMTEVQVFFILHHFPELDFILSKKKMFFPVFLSLWYSIKYIYTVITITTLHTIIYIKFNCSYYSD